MTINGQSWVAGQPIPFEPRYPTESTALYGQRVFLYIMATDGCTAPFSVEELELALSQSAQFYAGRYDVVGKARVHIPTDDRVVAAVRETRDRIGKSLRYRAHWEGTSTVPAVEPSKPDVGPMAKLKDQPIVRPPSGSLAEVEF